MTVELQQSNNENFEDSRIIYSGKNTAYFLSGLKDNTYYFRLKPVNGTWTDPITVHVAHHSIQKAVSLFIVGVLIFCSIIMVIIRGAKNEQ